MLDVAQIADIALAAVVKRYRLYCEDLVDHYVFKHYLCAHIVLNGLNNCLQKLYTHHEHYK